MAPRQVGKYTWTCVWGYRPACKEALRRAEEKLGRPPYTVEIFAEWNSMIPALAPPFLQAGLGDLFKNEEILADFTMERFTLNPAKQRTAENPTEFELFSDRMVRLYPKYEVTADRCLIRPGPDARRTNLK